MPVHLPKPRNPQCTSNRPTANSAARHVNILSAFNIATCSVNTNLESSRCAIISDNNSYSRCDSMTQATNNEKARLCHVIKTESFDGYGFNLHAEKGKTGQFIGKVDEGSPAEQAGLKQGDRILEVNGFSISNETHKQVVQRIKDIPDETRLLVITPAQEEEAAGTETNKKTNDSLTTNAKKNQANELLEPKTQQLNNNDKTPKQDESENTPQLNLGMTAAELRAKLLAKKKFDPKKESLDLKKKYDIVQKL